MKKIAIFLLLISTLFIACETDFEVNADWKEVMVVYGLLDQSQPQQYIKINKAFLGEGDALQMASVSGSVNYNPLDLEVKIYKAENVYNSFDTLFSYLEFYGELYKLKDSIILRDTILEKEDGLFATDKNIIYTTPSNFFLTNNANEKEYILSIVNKKSGKQVWAKSNLIHELILLNFSSNMGLYKEPLPDPPIKPLEKSQHKVKWSHSTNGKIYQIIARIFYEEKFHNTTNTIIDSIDWIQPLIVYDGGDEMHYTFEGEAFVNTLANKIKNTNSNLIARRLSSIKLLFTVGSEALHTYMNLNEPFEGIVQERPVFTNINNGIGLFSCRYNKSHPMSFPDYTKEGVSIDLDSLYFRTDFDFLSAN